MAAKRAQAGPVKERRQRPPEIANRYHVLFEGNPDAVLLTAGGGRILAANRAACALFALTEQEICEAPAGRLMESPNGDSRARAELTCIRKTGERFPAEAISIAVDGGRRAFLILRDIGDRKRAGDSLDLSGDDGRRLLIEALYDSAPVALCVLDTELRYVRLNHRLAELNRVPVEAHLGKSIREILPGPWADKMEPALRRVIESGEPLPTLEVCMRTAGIHRCVAIAGVPLKDDQGRVLGISLSAEDITERKRTEAALRESEERFRTLSDHLPEAAIFRSRLDPGGEPHIEFISAGIEFLTGVPPEECLNDMYAIKRGVAPEDRERLNQAFALSIERLAQFEVEFRQRHRATGEVRWSILRSTPTRNPDGSTTWDGIQLDITRRKQAEEALRQSEARYRLLHENLRDAFVQMTLDGRILECNDLFCQMLGYSQEELRNLSYRELTPEPWHASEDRVLREEILPRGYSDVYETEYRRKDGSVIPVELRTILSRDAAGLPAAMWALVRDISDRKEAERILADAKTRKDLLAEVTARLLASDEPQALIHDLAARVMSVLDCQVLFNYLVDFRANRLHLNAWAGIPEQTARAFEHLDFGVAVCGYVAQTGVRMVAEDIPCTPDPRTDSLRPLDVKAYACHPLLARGRVIGTLAFGSRSRSRFSEEDLEVMRAVTDHIAISIERARTRDFLQRSEALYRSVARNLPEGMVCVVDPEMRCICIEGELASRFGLQTENIEGLPVLGVVDEVLRPTVEAHFRHALSGETASYEMEIRGRLAWSQYTPLRDERGNVVGAMMLTLDITERRQAEEYLLHKQKLESIGLLAGGIAHDFNNILTGVIGNTSLALEQVRPDTAPLLESVLKQSERAAHLTRQLLAYSGKGQFFVRNLDLSRAIREMSEFLRLSIPKSIELRFAVEERLPSVLMDSGQLQQILMNLVINAGEAVEQDQTPHGSVFVSTGSRQIPAPFMDAIGQKASPGRYVFLEVADNGPGMDPETKERIFDPFFTTKFTGRGLGLAAVSGIVRSLNGAITVDTAPGKGTTFRVFFPSTVASPDTVDAIKPPGDARRTVLVIDDEAYVREFVSQALRQRDYHVVVTAGGEALAVWEALNGAVDLVILDIVLPGAGPDLLAEIRQRRSDVKVLLTSGYSEAEAKRMCGGQAGIRHIQKPYTAQILLEAVSRSMPAL